MPRYMHADQDKAYRAVITVTRDGDSKTHYRGPYAGKAQATAAVTREVKDGPGWFWRGGVVTGYVEVSGFRWERVPDEPAAGKFHTDSAGTRYINTGDESSYPWIRLGASGNQRQWFAWEEIKNK